MLGLRLASRSRAAQLAALLAVMLIGMAVAGGVRHDLAGAGRLSFVAGGSVAAVAASRVLAVGAALRAARRAAASGWMHAVGRSTGIALMVGLAVAGMALSSAGSATDWMPAVRLALVGWIYVAAIGAVSLMLGPMVGASAAASLTLVLVWLGGVPPSAMYRLLDAWPLVQRPVVWLWNILPLGWRAHRLHVDGEAQDAVLLAGWIVIGVVVAAWAAVRVPVASGQRGA